MNLSLILFLIGILGFVLNIKNTILMLISIEIMLLAITFLILVSSLGDYDTLSRLDENIFINSNVFCVDLNTITCLALIIFPLLGSLAYGFLGRKAVVSRAQLILTFITISFYIIYVYISKSYFVNTEFITVVNLVLLIGAIANICVISLNIDNKKNLALQATSIIIIAVLLINHTISLDLCSTSLLLCLWIGAVTSLFTSILELYDNSLRTKAIKLYSFTLILSVYLDYDVWLYNLNIVNKFLLFILITSSFYTLYLLTINAETSPESFLNQIRKIISNFLVNPSLFILLAGVSWITSYSIKSLYIGIICSFSIKIYTYLIIMFPLWIIISYIVYILVQIVTLCWVFFPYSLSLININIFTLRLNFSFHTVKKQINFTNGLFIFSLQYISFLYCNYTQEISKSSVNKLLDAKFKPSNIENITPRSSRLDTNEFMSPKLNFIKINMLRWLVDDTYEKFTSSNKLNKLSFKHEIIYPARLNSLNNLLIRNISSVEFYTETINYLSRVGQFYDYILYLTQRKIPSAFVSFDSIDGTPIINNIICHEIINLRTILKSMYESNEFSIQKNYNWNLGYNPFFSDYGWVPDLKADILRNNLLIIICYDRMQDSISSMANIKMKKPFYLVQSNELASYNTYFSSVFDSNNNRIYSSINSPCFFKSCLTSNLKKTLLHEAGLR